MVASWLVARLPGGEVTGNPSMICGRGGEGGWRGSPYTRPQLFKGRITLSAG